MKSNWSRGNWSRFFKNNLNKNNQIESFNIHLQVSGKKKFPTIVHMREAEEDTDFCITQAVKKYDTKGLIHCFTSTKICKTCIR